MAAWSTWGAIWGLIGALIALMLIYEFLPVALKRLRQRLKHGDGGKPYFGAQSDEYKNYDWSADLFREFFGQVRVAWSAYGQWRMAPFKGRFHTVDDDGFRVTPPATNFDAAQRHTSIAMYGGSTILGMGARDQGTVPAFLWRDLGASYKVTNRGQLAHTMSQEVTTLVEDLRKGQIPDVVVFFDGLNEVMTAEHKGKPGAIWQETNRAAEFNLLQLYRRADLRAWGLRALLPRTMSVLGIGDAPQDVPASLSDQDVQALAVGVIDRYFNNVKIVESLAKTFGFKAIFFWQPVITAKRVLTDFEQKFAAKADTPMFRAIYGSHAISNDPRFRNNANVFNFSDVLADVEDGLYYDEHHLSERGNALVSKAMAEHLESMIQAKTKS